MTPLTPHEVPLPPLYVYPHPVLRVKADDVVHFDAAIHSLVDHLTRVMQARAGASIAANQIGAPVRVIVVDPKTAGGSAQHSAPIVLINPKITWMAETLETAMEGCLSFPGVYLPIARPTACKVVACDIGGAQFEVAAEGLYARALLHEIDHLEGRLLIDFAKPLKRQMIDKRMRAYAKRALRRRAQAEASTRAKAAPAAKHPAVPRRRKRRRR